MISKVKDHAVGQWKLNIIDKGSLHNSMTSRKHRYFRIINSVMQLYHTVFFTGRWMYYIMSQLACSRLFWILYPDVRYFNHYNAWRFFFNKICNRFCYEVITWHQQGMTIIKKKMATHLNGAYYDCEIHIIYNLMTAINVIYRSL